MDRELYSAIEKSSRYGQYLTQSEYYTLLKYASITGPDGQAACDALASIKYLKDEPLRYVWSRDRYAEDRYAALGRQKVDTGGCYITSACMAALNEEFDDHCYELTTLRHYRDTWLKEHYPRDIALYYEKAPALVRMIDRRSDHTDIYKHIYSEMVMPSVRAIEANDYETARTIYRNQYLALEEQYGKEEQK